MRGRAGPAANGLTDEQISVVIARYPRPDINGQPPLVEGGGINPLWVPTYDLAMAAADLWYDYAAGLTGSYDFSADGASYSRSQEFDHAMGMGKFWASRRAIGTLHLLSPLSPDLSTGADSDLHN